MELPHIGKVCGTSNCLSKNDFLLLKCSYCKKDFCDLHSKSKESEQEAQGQGGHYCQSIPLDARTIICPVCSQILPVGKADNADLLVDKHIRDGCKKIQEKSIYTNQCCMKGCKKKELVPITCQICQKSFCIRHRLEQDHSCIGPPPSVGNFISDSWNKSNGAGAKNKCLVQ